MTYNLKQTRQEEIHCNTEQILIEWHAVACKATTHEHVNFIFQSKEIATILYKIRIQTGCFLGY